MWARSYTYTLTWDGRDETGQTLPPGTYIASIAADTEKGQQTHNRVIALAY